MTASALLSDHKFCFTDIAIGAPWGGENRKGIVYVYYGQRNTKEPLKLMQVKKFKN